MVADSSRKRAMRLVEAVSLIVVSVLVHAIHELKIEPSFWTRMEAA